MSFQSLRRQWTLSFTDKYYLDDSFVDQTDVMEHESTWNKGDHKLNNVAPEKIELIEEESISKM